MNSKLRSEARLSPAPPALARFVLLGLFCVATYSLAGPSTAFAQEPPYFVTYSHHLEEPGNLEVEVNSVFATQRAGNDFIAPWMEFEYGVKAWWTTELYLDTQTTFGDSTLFTGYRWENRFRPLMREHWINPVLYVEFEDINGADKIMREVVGFDGQADHAEPNSETRREHKHEIEAKLILSSDFKGWNISENFTGEKILGHEPWEFGYAVGASRPLRLAATPRPCNFCRENFLAGIEIYGGLGTASDFTLSGTSHYAAPILGWQLPNGTTLRISPGFGLNEDSHRFVLRWGVSYELAGFGRMIRSMF
ncbi:MAG TPA: hypothetical protein VNM68_00605 [Candidatus Polarisedimenticolia bacterium]|nr:hypothetical protein [Candidatus Polarisedimenticolia bacterium]